MEEGVAIDFAGHGVVDDVTALEPFVLLLEPGIDPERLDFQPMPAAGATSEGANTSGTVPVNTVGTTPAEVPTRMTIAEAKRALAATFGVSPDAIEITVRG